MRRIVPASSHRPLSLFLLLVSLGIISSCARPVAETVTWKPKTPPLSTQWTGQVTATNVLPEYPRPQMVRPDWQNLNGEWQFAGATADQSAPFGQTLAERVLVPFP